MGNWISSSSYLLKHPCSGRNITWQYLNSNGSLPYPYTRCPDAKEILEEHKCHDVKCGWAITGLVVDEEYRRYQRDNWDGMGDPKNTPSPPPWMPTSLSEDDKWSKEPCKKCSIRYFHPRPKEESARNGTKYDISVFSHQHSNSQNANIFSRRNLPELRPYQDDLLDNRTARNGTFITLAVIILLIFWALAWRKFHERRDRTPRWMRGNGTQSGGLCWDPNAEERLVVDDSSFWGLQRHEYRD